MRRALLSLLLTFPLLAQLPVGVSRVTFRDDLTDATYLAATGDVLWVSSLLDDSIERVELGGVRTGLAIPPYWQLTSGFAVGPDGALWLGASGWIARVDPATNGFERWALGPGGGPTSILSGVDGNVWFLRGRSVVRMRPDGVFLSTYDAGGTPTDAAFGSDGALYLSLPGKLVRMTAAGERTELPASPRRVLFAGTNFLWTVDLRSHDEAGLTPDQEMVRMSYRGETLATYRIAMSPIAADALGNLWLRAKTAEGDVVGQLTPSGVLTRFGPLPSPVSTDCDPRSFGGFAFLSDGRVAMTDFYWIVARAFVGPCVGVSRPEGARNTITILDPRLAPVLSVEVLERPTRRRTTRH